MSDASCDLAGTPLLPYQDAISTLLDNAPTVPDIESVEVEHCLDRVLASDLTAGIDVPPLANSAMDGYAVHSRDLQAGEAQTLRVTQRIAAGDIGKPLQPGCAARIFTGAPVPPGCDAVIMQEQVEAGDGEIRFESEVSPGQNIRAAGEDIRRGQVIIQRGRKLRAQELGLAASVGQSTLEVFRRVRVAAFFTGDELVEPGQPLAPGKIYDSNRYTLNGLLAAMGCEVIDLGLVGDTLDATRRALLDASSNADLVITSGGVSVGEEDHVRVALQELGELRMWRLNIKPGKPLAFGRIDDAAFIGLPGNPVSAFATFCVFVAPFIKSLQGCTDRLPPKIPVRAGFEWPRPGKRLEFVRARLQIDADQVLAEIYPHQGSGVLMSTSWADGFVVVPPETRVTPGDRVEYFSFDAALT
jgi:molybdopterin molybdotransferase